MLQVTLLVASLALADAVNPVTIALALYLASDERPHARVAGFTAGVIGVLPLLAGRRWRTLAGRARLALDRFAPAVVAAPTAVMGGGLIVRGADGLLS